MKCRLSALYLRPCPPLLAGWMMFTLYWIHGVSRKSQLISIGISLLFILINFSPEKEPAKLELPMYDGKKKRFIFTRTAVSY